MVTPLGIHHYLPADNMITLNHAHWNCRILEILNVCPLRPMMEIADNNS